MKISVLMATYNPNKLFLEKSIQSIINQTYKNLEFIIVDDGSEKKVEDTIKSIGIKDSRIKIIRSENNLGLPKALNMGLKYCTGEYIARMDDDDISLQNRLEEQIKYIKANNFIGSWTKYDIIDNNGKIIKTKNRNIKNNNDILKQLIKNGNIFCHTSLFVRKDIINELGGYDENLRYAQDNDLYIRIVQKYNMGYINKSLVMFRINNERSSIYKDSFSLMCSLFPVYRFYLENRNNFKYKIWVIERFIKFIVFSLITYPKSKKV